MPGGIPGTVWIWAWASQKVKPRAAQRRAPRSCLWPTSWGSGSREGPILTAGSRFPDGFDAALDDEVEARLAQLGARAAWVPIDAVRFASRRGLQLFGANEGRIDGHRKGGIRKTRVRADLFGGETLALEILREVLLGGGVVLLDRMCAHRRLGPFAVQARRGLGHRLLVAAVVADEDDVLEAVEAESARGRLQRLLADIVGHRDRPRKAHVGGGRIDRALGHIGDHGCYERVAQGSGDLPGEELHARVVLAQHHVGTVLLGAADGDDDGRFSRLGGVPHLGPGEVLEEDGSELRHGGCRPERPEGGPDQNDAPGRGGG